MVKRKNWCLFSLFVLPHAPKNWCLFSRLLLRKIEPSFYSIHIPPPLSLRSRSNALLRRRCLPISLSLLSAAASAMCSASVLSVPRITAPRICATGSALAAATWIRLRWRTIRAHHPQQAMRIICASCASKVPLPLMSMATAPMPAPVGAGGESLPVRPSNLLQSASWTACAFRLWRTAAWF